MESKFSGENTKYNKFNQRISGTRYKRVVAGILDVTPNLRALSFKLFLAGDTGRTLSPAWGTRVQIRFSWGHGRYAHGSKGKIKKPSQLRY